MITQNDTLADLQKGKFTIFTLATKHLLPPTVLHKNCF